MAIGARAEQQLHPSATSQGKSSTLQKCLVHFKARVLMPCIQVSVHWGTRAASAAQGRWNPAHLAPGPQCTSALHCHFQPGAQTALGPLAARASALQGGGQSQLREVQWYCCCCSSSRPCHACCHCCWRGATSDWQPGCPALTRCCAHRQTACTSCCHHLPESGGGQRFLEEVRLQRKGSLITPFLKDSCKSVLHKDDLHLYSP